MLYTDIPVFLLTNTCPNPSILHKEGLIQSPSDILSPISKAYFQEGLFPIMNVQGLTERPYLQLSSSHYQGTLIICEKPDNIF